MQLQRLLAFALLPALLGACQDDDKDTDTASTEATTGATDATTGPTTGATDATTGPTTGADDSTGQATTDTGSFPAVECGMMMCTEGQVCVQPGLRCDNTTDPPEFYEPEPECSDVPPECQDKTGDELRDCLGGPLCPNHDPGLTEYKDGQLTCPPEALDCF